MLEDVVERLTEQLEVAAESLKSTSEDFRQALEERTQTSRSPGWRTEKKKSPS